VSKPSHKIHRLYWACTVAVALAVGWSAELRSAESPESSLAFGPKYMTVHNVKGLVGPSVQIDDGGMIAAAWVEEDKDTRTILFARSKAPGGPLGAPVAVNQPGESPYYRQEAPALIVRGQDVFILQPTCPPVNDSLMELLVKMNYREPLCIHIEYPWASDGQRTRAAMIETLKSSRRQLADWWQRA